jgi:hypothetical protein
VARNAQVDLVWHGKRLYRLDLFQLVQDRLYVVTENMKTHSGRLLEGEILSANLRLTRRNGFNPNDPEQINYHRYRNIYEAMRGLGMARRKYDALEVPDLHVWKEGLQQLLIMVGDFTVGGGQDLAAEIFAAMVKEQAERQQWVEDPDKVKAYEQTIGLTLHDSRDRFNPGRLPLKIFSAKDALTRRQGKTRIIGLKMDGRVAVLAAHLVALLAKRDEIEVAVCRLLQNNRVFGPKFDAGLLQRKAAAMEEYATTLFHIHTRPFGPWSFRHTAKDLVEAATFLRAGDQQAARVFLERIKAAMHLVYLRVQFERVLTVVSRAERLGEILSREAREQLSNLTLRSNGWLGYAVRADWRNDSIRLAVSTGLSELNHTLRFGSDLKKIKKDLKAICKPI